MRHLAGWAVLVGFGLSAGSPGCKSDEPVPTGAAGAAAGAEAGAGGTSAAGGAGSPSGAAGAAAAAAAGAAGTGVAGQAGQAGQAGGGAAGAAGASASMPADTKIRFLHHSTGGIIWAGGVADFFSSYNAAHAKAYVITEQDFPKSSPYGWNNYPYDYWNIWVNHGGDQQYLTEPTLELLTKSYDVIVFKHCFPVSALGPDGTADVASQTKTVANYKVQYEALKTKLRAFPQQRFILWTGAALRQADTNEQQAQRAKAFFDWVKGTWDEPGDNIFLWDFWQLETEGGLYLTPENATGDSHPSASFAAKAAPLLGRRIVEVIEGRGDTASLTGQ